MEKFKKAFLLFFLAVLALFVCINLPFTKDRDDRAERAEDIAPAPEAAEYSPEPQSPAQAAHYVTIIAAGDNLYHNVMVRDGEHGDYESAYSEIRSLVQQADIAFINQETLLGGEQFGFSGYPLFNSPQALGRALAAVGFNVVNHANNHAMDKGERAVFATMDFWDTFPQVSVLGIHRSAEHRASPVLITKNNITLGFLSYSFSTNGIPLPTDKPFLVSLIDRQIMTEEINALRPLCDFLVVSMHWGQEYQHYFSRNQESLAAFLAEYKVDLLIGHHPHVLQPIEYRLRPDGRFMLCFYSLGNFLSAQRQNPTLLGAMAYVKIRKTDMDVVIMDSMAIPVVTHYERNYTGFKVYPLYAYTEELLAKHLRNQTTKELTMDYLNRLSEGILGIKKSRRSPFS